MKAQTDIQENKQDLNKTQPQVLIGGIQQAVKAASKTDASGAGETPPGLKKLSKISLGLHQRKGPAIKTGNSSKPNSKDSKNNLNFQLTPRNTTINVNQNIFINNSAQSSAKQSTSVHPQTQGREKVIEQKRSRAKRACQIMLNEIYNALEYLFVYMVMQIGMKLVRILTLSLLFVLRLLSLPVTYALFVCEYLFQIRKNDLPERSLSKCRCKTRKQLLKERQRRSQEKQKLLEYLEKEGGTYHQKRRLNVVLDLDQTLIHSTYIKPTDTESNYFQIKGEKIGEPLYVFKRPHLEYFIQELHKFAEVSVFTAGMKDYADAILSNIDPHNLIKVRCYREHCKRDQKGNLYKDLSSIQVDLSRLIMVDDSWMTFLNFKSNTYRIKPWTRATKNDNCLKECLSILQEIQYSEDVPSELPQLVEIFQSFAPQ